LRHYCCYPAHEGSDKLVLFAVLHDVSCQHLAITFVVDLLEKFGYFVALIFILTFVQFLFEFFELLLTCSLVLCLANIGQLKVEFPFKLIFEYFCVFRFVDVLLHDIVNFHQLALKIFDSGIVVGGIDDDF
jgi:hypothetical protein